MWVGAATFGVFICLFFLLRASAEVIRTMVLYCLLPPVCSRRCDDVPHVFPFSQETEDDCDVGDNKKKCQQRRGKNEPAAADRDEPPWFINGTYGA